MQKSSPLIYLIVALFIFSCSATLNPNDYGHQDYSDPHDPELSSTVLGIYNEKGEPSLNLNVDINSKSLIYRLQNTSMVARAVVNIKLINVESKKTITKKYKIRIKHPLSTGMNNLGTYKLDKQYKLPAGDYKVQVALTDKNSGEKANLENSTSIPRASTKKPILTNIRLSGFNSERQEYQTVNRYNVPASLDTLKFIVSISVPEGLEEPLQMTSTLFNFASDTMASRPIGDADYSTSSIQYKGVNYYQKEIIRSSSRKLINKGNISVEYKYTSLERGNYRFRAQLLESEIVGEQNSSKDFAVRSKNFPLLKTPHERAQSMAYLMDDKEHKELLSIKNSDSLQNAIDSFWYTNIGDITKAQNAKSQYFDRVLTANKEFTNFKEGWKTDQGMVFILFGNPWVIDKDFETKTWFYSYNRLDEDKTFEFFRTRVKNDSFPFKNYILERKFDYNNVLYKQKRLWFTGQILETQI